MANVQHLMKSTKERESLYHITALMKKMLNTYGIPHLHNQSHIIPVLIPGAARCKHVTDTLLHTHNIYVQPINYPTVPRGKERLRVTPTPFHTEAMVKDFCIALRKILGDLEPMDQEEQAIVA